MDKEECTARIEEQEVEHSRRPQASSSARKQLEFEPLLIAALISAQ